MIFHDLPSLICWVWHLQRAWWVQHLVVVSLSIARTQAQSYSVQTLRGPQQLLFKELDRAWVDERCLYINIYKYIYINLSIYLSINLSIYLSKYICICVCVEHLNRCKTSTCWRFRFSWFFSVSGISLCWRSCLHDCAVIYLHSRGAVHDWQTLLNEVSSAYLHGF